MKLTLAFAAALFCASPVLAHTGTLTYTLLHRVTRTMDGEEKVSPWFPRMLLTIPTTPQGMSLASSENFSSNLEFPEAYENALYQLKMVPGDARSYTDEENRQWIDRDAGFLSSVKLVR